ncbi:MAG: carboxypeptidase regulatory-like domain-containing protein, partial [Chloroflexi bacterium]|nr:carboxypeptidase regulatory-like domain-containing protein [Chloroflexota bacterium]
MQVRTPHVWWDRDKRSNQTAARRLLLAAATVLTGALVLALAIAFVVAGSPASVAALSPSEAPAADLGVAGSADHLASSPGPESVNNVTIGLTKVAAPDPDGYRLVGDTVVFTITIRNEDLFVPIEYLPLRDVYSPTRLTYVSASPTPQTVTAGLLEWEDLITDPRGGTLLDPGDSMTVIVTFTAQASGVTTNTASIRGAYFQGVSTPVDAGPAPAAVTIYDLDFGDAPDPAYPTLLASNGARHMIIPGFFLGALIDGELNGQPNATATGDNLANLPDEDGITFLTPLVQGKQATIQIISSQAGKLDAWIDWNADGDWNDAGEQILASANLLGGLAVANINVPATAKLGVTFARFRLSTAGGLAPTGFAPDGEVEDYMINVVPDGAIGDYLWYDTNGNSLQDVGEPGIGNVTLSLYRDADGNGVFNPITDTLVATTTTDADGGYLFNGLRAATYFVDVTDANGILTGLTHTIGPESKPDPTAAIVLATGQVYRDADFGYYKTPTSGNAIIGDFVWYDGDGDGMQDPGEPGMPGVTVCATPLVGAPICTTTDANGHYLLDVPPGTYTVAPTAGVPGGLSPSNTNPQTVTVAAGQQYLDADFGYFDGTNNLLGQIGGTIWDDTLLQNGVLNVNEPRIPSVSVDLIRDTNNNGVWDAGEPIIATATTDQNGDYSFDGVPAGNYLVKVSDTQNALADYTVGPLGNPLLDNNSKAQPYRVVLPAGGLNTTADFGYIQNGTTNQMGIIGNQVWFETDRDGLFEPQNGEIGIPGVTVDLQNALGQVISTTTTGASGDYVFTGLPAGTYRVAVSDTFGILTNYVVTALGPNPGQDNNNQAQPYTVVLPVNGINTTADFGYLEAYVDLVITKSDGGVSSVPGGIVTYTLNYTNVGTTTATGVVITETVPPNSAAYAGSGWTCVGSTCTRSFANIPAGGGAGSVTFAVTVNNPLPAGVIQIDNVAVIGDDGTSGPDRNPADNTATDNTPINATPDMTIIKSDGGVGTVPGGTVVYTLTYANVGNQGAAGVTITDTVPANSTFNPGASTVGWACLPNNNAGSLCTYTVGAVAGDGAGGAVKFALTVVNPLPAGVTLITNTAWVQDNGANGADPTPANNQSTDTTPVTAAPDLRIVKSDGGISSTPGGVITYTLTYSNAGN